MHLRKENVKMGSVIDYVECKRCGRDAFVDFNYNTGEEFSSCSYCGKGFSDFIKRDEEGKFMRDKEGKFIREYIENNGNGVACLAFENGVNSIHVAPEDVSKYDERLESVIKEIEINPDINKELSYVTKWNPEKEELAVVYGEILDYSLESKDIPM